MGKDEASLLRRLRTLTKGLSYMSESDYPVQPFMQAGKDQPTLTAQDVVNAQRSAPDAPVSELTFERFFQNVAQEQDWQSAETRAMAKQFQALRDFLTANLSDIKVYRVGGTEADVYVLGKTKGGNFAGVTTKVVET